MDIQQLQTTLREFASQRQWQSFHSPKNLSMALMVECAELMELFQWKTTDESLNSHMDPFLRQRVGEEAADVLLYLLQLVDQAGVNLEAAVRDKLVRNAQKYPAPAPPPESVTREETADILPAPTVMEESASTDPSTLSTSGTDTTALNVDAPPVAPRTHVLIDWENVQPTDRELRDLVPQVTHTWVFHSPNQKRVAEKFPSLGDELTLVPISRQGKNALDFHLSYYVGYINSRHPQATFIVLSNDQGYGPMIEHANELGFNARQLGFSPAKKSAPVETPTETGPAPALSTTPATKAAALTQSASKALAAPKVPKPKHPAQAASSATTMAAAPAKATENPTAKALPKSATKANSTQKSKAATPNTAKTAKRTPVRPKTPQPVAAATKKPAAAKVAAAPTAKPAPRSYEHVLNSLRKFKGKPRHKDGVYAIVKSLIRADETGRSQVLKLLDRLQKDGHLVFSDEGLVIKTP